MSDSEATASPDSVVVPSGQAHEFTEVADYDFPNQGSRRPLILWTSISLVVIFAVAATLMFAFGSSRSNSDLRKATNQSFVVEYHGAMNLLKATNTCNDYKCVNKAAAAAYDAQISAVSTLGGGFSAKSSKKYETYKADLLAIADTYKSLETAKTQVVVAQFYGVWQTQFRTSAHDGYVLLHSIGK